MTIGGMSDVSGLKTAHHRALPKVAPTKSPITAPSAASDAGSRSTLGVYGDLS